MKRREQLRTDRKMNKKARKKLMTDVCEDSSWVGLFQRTC